MAALALTPEEISSASERLAQASPQKILLWAVTSFFPRLTMGTAFGVEGCCLIHMLAEIEPRVSLFNLETGYQFAETLDLREKIRKRYGMVVTMVRPEKTVAEYEAGHAVPLYRNNPDQCCLDRKIIPLRKVLLENQAWISAIRRDQTADRRRSDIVQWDAKFGLIKVNPLLNWTRKDVWKFALENQVPYNPLHDQGYPSIGCWPCTRPVNGQETDERAGRWAGTQKKECGLHVMEHSDGSGI